MTETDHALLAMERRWWRMAGHKEQAIRDELGLSAVRYYQQLTALIQREDALVHDPVLVNRLRRLTAPRNRLQHIHTAGEH